MSVNKPSSAFRGVQYNTLSTSNERGSCVEMRQNALLVVSGCHGGFLFIWLAIDLVLFNALLVAMFLFYVMIYIRHGGQGPLASWS